MNFFTLLTVLFIGLKLTNYINWSWWLVLLPLYSGIILLLCIMLFGFSVTMLSGKKTYYKFRR
jgi:hypothetical protein